MEDISLHEKANNFNLISWIKQFIKFSLVGSITTVLGLSCYYIFLEIYDFNIYIVYSLVNVFLIYLSYVLNAKFTFNKKTNIHDTVKFYTVHTFGLVIGLIALSILEHYQVSTKFVHCVITIPLRIALTFILMKLFIFAQN